MLEKMSGIQKTQKPTKKCCDSKNNWSSKTHTPFGVQKKKLKVNTGKNTRSCWDSLGTPHRCWIEWTKAVNSKVTATWWCKHKGLTILWWNSFKTWKKPTTRTPTTTKKSTYHRPGPVQFQQSVAFLEERTPGMSSVHTSESTNICSLLVEDFGLDFKGQTLDVLQTSSSYSDHKENHNW